MLRYQTFDVPAAGGRLRVGVWGHRGPVVLAAHGMTANHIFFEPLAEQLGDSMRLIAPDLRGRGKSRDINEPWGVGAHVHDLKILLDYFKVPKVDLLLGHALGGFIVAAAAAEHSHRVKNVMLVDGGIPVIDQIPHGLTVEQFVRTAVGPTIQRLAMRFESHETYHRLWREHPAFAHEWSAYVERYLDYDLVGQPPKLEANARKDAVMGDVESQVMDDLIPRSLKAIRSPVRLLRAPRGLMNGEPLYSAERVESWSSVFAHFSYSTVPDVNHYTILLSACGARAVAAEIGSMLAAVTRSAKTVS